jgi:hypothetical protein
MAMTNKQITTNQIAVFGFFLIKNREMKRTTPTNASGFKNCWKKSRIRLNMFFSFELNLKL